MTTAELDAARARLGQDGPIALQYVKWISNALHGGGDIALQSMISHMLVRGMVTYSSGTGCGRPYIHLGPIGIGVNNGVEERKDFFELFGKRVGEQTIRLFAKNS